MAGDMGFFGKMMFPRVFKFPIPEFHEEMYRLYIDRSVAMKAVIAPRHHAKSTCGAFVLPMHRISYNERGNPLFIIILSESEQQSKAFLGNIRQALRFNEVYRHYFGDLLAGKGIKDTEGEIITNNQVCILARGTGQKIRGLQFMNERPGLIVADDFESEFNTNTLEARVANKKWMSAAVENSLADDGEMVFNGTIVHPDAYLCDIRNDPAFKVLFYDAEIDMNGNQGEGISLWPEKWPWKRLMAKKASLDARGVGFQYWQEYRNEPMDPADRAFKTENMCYWDGYFELDDEGTPWVIITWKKERGESQRFDPPLRVPVNTYLGVDLNAKDYGDYGVILPMGIDADGNNYFDDYIRKRMDSDLVIEHMFDFYRRYHTEMIVIETTGYQEQLKRSFLKMQEMRGVYIPVKGVDSKTKKSLRHNEMVPDHKLHKIWIKSSHTIAEAEMKGHPKPPSDDWLDAAWNCRQFATEPSVLTPKAQVASTRRRRIKTLTKLQRVQRNFKLL